MPRRQVRRPPERLAFATAPLHILVVPPKKRRPALSAEELRNLAKSFRDVARRAHEFGEVQKAERFERKAVDCEGLARKASEPASPKGPIST
jgi:hypothetical protein